MINRMPGTRPALALLVTALSFFASTAASAAQAYPNKPIRFVIPFPPGSFSDVTGRLFGQALSKSVSQPVVMDTRAGASGNIGAEIVARAAPDGYTLLLNSFNYVANPGAMSLPFDPIADFAPISLIADGIPLVLVVSAGSPYTSVQNFIAQTKAQPGRLNFATAGRGTSSHLAILTLRQAAGMDVNQVPFKGSSQSIGPLVAGEIAASIPYLNVVMPLVKAGRLRALAVTGDRRTPSLPQVPTMIESGYPALRITGFAGLLAPARTPRPIVVQLHKEMAAASKQKDLIERLAVYDLEPVASRPEHFAKFLATEIAKWKKVLADAGEKPGS